MRRVDWAIEPRSKKKSLRLRISTHGDVSSEFQAEVAEIVRECYARFTVPLPPLVTLRFFDTAARLRAEQERERRILGIVSGGGDPLPVAHSGWGDTPRITVCVERLAALPELLRQGMVRVAAAHAVLHGSPDYYLFKIPAEVVRQGQKGGMSSAFLQQLFYQVATAVKGHAAVQLLVRHQFIADQVALAMHQLQVSLEDLVAWRLARTDARARALYLTAQLRPLLGAQPLLAHAPSLAEAMHKLTAHLPPTERERLLSLSAHIIATLSGDTLADIQRAFALTWEELVLAHL